MFNLSFTTACHIVLLVQDISRPEPEDEALLSELADHGALIRVANKCDLVEAAPFTAGSGDAGPVLISAKTGQGLEDLKREILARIGAGTRSEGSFSARQRHVDALKRVARHLEGGQRVMQETAAGELLAEELRLAQSALGEITGEMLPDDLLGEIFSSFCIGK